MLKTVNSQIEYTYWCLQFNFNSFISLKPILRDNDKNKMVYNGGQTAP